MGNSQSVPEVPHGSVRHEAGRHSVQLYGGGLCASSGHLLSTTLLARPTRFELVTSAFGGLWFASRGRYVCGSLMHDGPGTQRQHDAITRTFCGRFPMAYLSAFGAKRTWAAASARSSAPLLTQSGHKWPHFAAVHGPLQDLLYFIDFWAKLARCDLFFRGTLAVPSEQFRSIPRPRRPWAWPAPPQVN